MEKIYKVIFRGEEVIASNKGLDTLQLLVSTQNTEHPPQLSLSAHGDYGKEKPTKISTWILEAIKPGDKFEFEYLGSGKATSPVKKEEIGPYKEHCSFCGKSKDEVEILIEGNKYIAAHICNECVDTCVEVIHEKREENNT